MVTKQELHDLLAKQLNDDLSTMIRRLDNAEYYSRFYTPHNASILHHSRVLIRRAVQLRDSIVTTADNGLERSDPYYTSYRVEEEQPEYVRVYEGSREIAMAEMAAQCKILSGAENTLKTE